MKIKLSLIIYMLFSAIFNRVACQSLDFNKTDYKNRFSGVLLVIHFNHPHYENINFLKNLYSSGFDNIVFYGEKSHPDIIDIHTNTGHLLSDVIKDVLLRFPNYKGYLFLQDDCVLNFWNYASLDLTKIWYAVKFNDSKVYNDKFYDIRNFNGRNWGLNWGGWGTKWGFEQAKLAYGNLMSRDLEFLEKNLGKNNIPIMMCEVFYIPQRFNETMQRLCSIFKQVFCEIAVTSMLCSLDLIENWEQLHMIGGEGIGHGYNDYLLSKYPKNVHWLHPVKFSNHKNREVINQIFKQILMA